MANYKLSQDAKTDLIRIHQYGVRTFGEVQADRYYMMLFDYFDDIAEHPYQYPTVDYIREGYRRCVCGVDSIYYSIENNTVEIISIIGR